MSLSKGDMEEIRKIVREELTSKIENLDNRFDDLETRFENLDNRFDDLETRFNRLKKSRGGLIIAPRVSHVRSLGNSMDRSDIEEIPNSAYKI